MQNASKIRATGHSFGTILDGRTYGNFGRVGFNSKENDGEVSGEGNVYDYGFRIYNTRLAKFLSVDPLSDEYAYYTPYQFAGNKPIWAIDIDGLEEVIATELFSKGKYMYYYSLNPDPEIRARDKGKIAYKDPSGKLTEPRDFTKFEVGVTNHLKKRELNKIEGAVGYDKSFVQKVNAEETIKNTEEIKGVQEKKAEDKIEGKITKDESKTKSKDAIKETKDFTFVVIEIVTGSEQTVAVDALIDKQKAIAKAKYINNKVDGIKYDAVIFRPTKYKIKDASVGHGDFKYIDTKTIKVPK